MVEAAMTNLASARRVIPEHTVDSLSVKTAVRMEVVALDQIVVHVSMDSLAPSVRETIVPVPALAK